MYDFKLDICRTFHKNARSYSIIDLSLDGTKIMTISVTSNDSQNNVFKIIEIGTNKILLEIDNLYVYEANFTANPRYIIMRARDVNIMKVFIYVFLKGKNKLFYPLYQKYFQLYLLTYNQTYV